MGNFAAVYSPTELLSSWRTRPFSGLLTTTLAPGITAPVVSVTVPTIVAVSCPVAEEPAANISKQTTARQTNVLRMESLLSKACVVSIVWFARGCMEGARKVGCNSPGRQEKVGCAETGAGTDELPMTANLMMETQPDAEHTISRSPASAC